MLIGIDLGTQSLKAALVDERFNIKAEASISYNPSFPAPGWAEQNPTLWENALLLAINKILEKPGIDKTSITGIAFTGQLDGCIPVNKNVEPLAPCIIWMDRRADKEVTSIPADFVSSECGVILDSTHMAAKIAWFRNHAKFDIKDVFCYHQPTSYMVARLTGNRVMDHALASTTMLYSLKKQGYCDELFDYFHIDPQKMPEIKYAYDAAGNLTEKGAKICGLPAGIPVSVGTGDDFTNILGAGVVNSGVLTCTIGTAEVVGALHPFPVIDKAGLVETHSYVTGNFFIENPGWLSGGSLEWLKELFQISNVNEINNMIKNIHLGSNDLTFIPALSGSMTPEWHSNARGCFYGLTPAHTNAHFAKSLMEGCAYGMRDIKERLQSMGVVLDSVLLLGGGAKSREWAQIRADISGLPVEIPSNTDVSSIGATLLASVTAGVYSNLSEATSVLNIEKEIIDPIYKNIERYNEHYFRYRKLFNCLKPLF